MKITLDAKCSFCGREEENSVHFFYQCHVVNLIWGRFTDWLYNLTSFRINLFVVHVLFGFIEKRNDALNCLIIWTKQQVYSARIRKIIPTFETIKQYIRKCYKNERQISIMENKTHKFDLKMGKFRKNSYRLVIRFPELDTYCFNVNIFS